MQREGFVVRAVVVEDFQIRVMHFDFNLVIFCSFHMDLLFCHRYVISDESKDSSLLPVSSVVPYALVSPNLELVPFLQVCFLNAAYVDIFFLE